MSSRYHVHDPRSISGTPEITMIFTLTKQQNPFFFSGSRSSNDFLEETGDL